MFEYLLNLIRNKYQEARYNLSQKMVTVYSTDLAKWDKLFQWG